MSRTLTFTSQLDEQSSMSQFSFEQSPDLSLDIARKCLSSMVKCVISLPPWVEMYLTGSNVP